MSDSINPIFRPASAPLPCLAPCAAARTPRRRWTSCTSTTSGRPRPWSRQKPWARGCLRPIGSMSSTSSSTCPSPGSTPTWATGWCRCVRGEGEVKGTGACVRLWDSHAWPWPISVRGSHRLSFSLQVDLLTKDDKLLGRSVRPLILRYRSRIVRVRSPFRSMHVHPGHALVVLILERK